MFSRIVMAPDQHVQALIFVVREKTSDSKMKSSNVKAFALLPHKLEIGSKITELFSNSRVQILRNANGPFPQFCRENDSVEMVEVLFNKANVVAEVLDKSKPVLFHDLWNEETVKLIFGNDFCLKTKLNFDSIVLAMDGSEDVIEVLKQLFAFRVDIDYANLNGGTLLHFAVERKYYWLCELLLEYRADVSAVNEDGATPLHIAACKGSLKLARLLLQHEAPVNEKTTSNLMKDSTALHFAVRHEHARLVKFLLEQRGNVDAEDYDGTVLLQAVKKQDVIMVKHILSHRPDINHLGNRQALFEAVFTGNKIIVKTLLWWGLSAKEDATEQRELLCHAIVKGFLPIVKQLLDGGVALNDGYEIPPLHLAAQCGSREMVRLLLKAGASINLKSSDKHLPIIYALEGSQFVRNEKETETFKQIFNLLIDDDARIHVIGGQGKTTDELIKRSSDAQIEVLDFQGRTALHKAAAKGNTKLVKRLIQDGADVNARCREGKTPLHYAAEDCWFNCDDWDDVMERPSPLSQRQRSQYCSSDLFASIISAGADVNAKCNKGRTPLFYAVGKPRFFDVRDLLDLGADIDAKDFASKTPLHIASENGFIVFILALIHSGADINARCMKGKTPLMYAAGKDHYNAVIVLLLHDARIDIISCSGQTALDEAYEGYLPELLETLLCYCFSDRGFLVTSVARPHLIIRRPLPEDPQDWILERLSPHFLPTEFNKVYERHVVRVEAAVPFARIVPTPCFQTEGMNDFKQDASSEIDLMKILPVGDSDTSFYDVLTYSSNQLAFVSKDDVFVKAMQKLYYREKIPVYADIIEMKFQQAYRRRMLMDCRSVIFKLLCPEFFYLLDELQEHIISFLSNADLMRAQIACTFLLAPPNQNGHAKNINEQHLLLEKLHVACSSVPSSPNYCPSDGNEVELYSLLCCRTNAPRALRQIDELDIIQTGQL